MPHNTLTELVFSIGWAAGGYLGAAELPVIAEEGATALAENYGVEALANIIFKITEQGVQVLDPITGLTLRVIGGVAGGFIGRKISTLATRKYIVRTSISTEKPQQDLRRDLIFEPVR